MLKAKFLTIGWRGSGVRERLLKTVTNKALCFFTVTSWTISSSFGKIIGIRLTLSERSSETLKRITKAAVDTNKSLKVVYLTFGIIVSALAVGSLSNSLRFGKG